MKKIALIIPITIFLLFFSTVKADTLINDNHYDIVIQSQSMYPSSFSVIVFYHGNSADTCNLTMSVPGMEMIYTNQDGKCGFHTAHFYFYNSSYSNFEYLDGRSIHIEYYVANSTDSDSGAFDMPLRCDYFPSMSLLNVSQYNTTHYKVCVSYNMNAGADYYTDSTYGHYLYAQGNNNIFQYKVDTNQMSSYGVKCFYVPSEYTLYTYGMDNNHNDVTSSYSAHYYYRNWIYFMIRNYTWNVGNGIFVLNNYDDNDKGYIVYDNGTCRYVNFNLPCLSKGVSRYKNFFFFYPDVFDSTNLDDIITVDMVNESFYNITNGYYSFHPNKLCLPYNTEKQIDYVIYDGKIVDYTEENGMICLNDAVLYPDYCSPGYNYVYIKYLSYIKPPKTSNFIVGMFTPYGISILLGGITLVMLVVFLGTTYRSKGEARLGTWLVYLLGAFFVLIVVIYVLPVMLFSESGPLVGAGFYKSSGEYYNYVFYTIIIALVASVGALAYFIKKEIKGGGLS